MSAHSEACVAARGLSPAASRTCAGCLEERTRRRPVLPKYVPFGDRSEMKPYSEDENRNADGLFDPV